MEVSGGAGIFRPNQLERLFRDARCGPLPPDKHLIWFTKSSPRSRSASISAGNRVGGSLRLATLITRGGSVTVPADRRLPEAYHA
jgi:hypothetical protein